MERSAALSGEAAPTPRGLWTSELDANIYINFATDLGPYWGFLSRFGSGPNQSTIDPHQPEGASDVVLVRRGSEGRSYKWFMVPGSSTIYGYDGLNEHHQELELAAEPVDLLTTPVLAKVDEVTLVVRHATEMVAYSDATE